MKILLIEDIKPLGNLYKKKLSKIFPETELATTVFEAEELFNNFQPELCIVDHGLNNLETTGLDLCKRFLIKKPKTKIILLSNFDHPELKEEANFLGINEILKKIEYSPKKLALHLESIYQKLS